MGVHSQWLISEIRPSPVCLMYKGFEPVYFLYSRGGRLSDTLYSDTQRAPTRTTFKNFKES